MNEATKLVIGLFATVLAGQSISYFMRTGDFVKGLPYRPFDKPERPEGLPENLWLKWTSATKRRDDSAAELLGCLERLTYFGGFFMSKPEIIAVWLAFKVASKWEVWTNIVRIPNGKELCDEEERVDSLAFLSARYALSSRTLLRYLIGNLLNILAAFFGYLVGEIFYESWNHKP